ncbi:MAG: hypothetical protein QOH13_1197 [Thermoleophilaceae bacterium]|jgi:hypothetical protein|nr:hypothetical protein [Thermoleophilaceae bacterium]
MKTIRVAPVIAACVVALLAAGCGGSSSGSGSDTAKLAPDSSFLYAEAALDPAGAQQAGMRSILGDLPGSGPPEQRLNNLLEQASKSDKSSKVDYLKDVKPWLGDKAAVFVAGSSQLSAGAKTPWAVVIATTDEAAARDTIAKDTGSNARKQTYHGTDYLIDTSNGDTAQGVVDGFLVVGSDAGMKAAIDASKGQSLSASDRYKEAIKDANSDRVALVYEDLSGILQAVAGASGGSLGPAAPLLGRMFGGKPVVATISAEQQALVIDGSLVPSGALGSLLGSSTPLVGDAPADSWLAAGKADFGQSLKSLLGLVGGAFGGEQALANKVRSATGLDIDKDLLGWMGDAAFFVDGDSKATIGGGALIQSKDPAASKAALTKLAALVAKQGGGAQVSAATVGSGTGYKIVQSSAPRGVFLLQAGDKVALTYGEEAAKAALAGGGLSGAPGFTKAAGALGAPYLPSLYISAPPILSLVESLGAGGAGYAKAKPYLTILDYWIAGSAKDGSTVKSRSRIGFKPGG